MDIIRIVLMMVIGVAFFGLPIWNLARLAGRRHVLWAIVPPVLFISLLAISNLLEGSEHVGWFMVTRHGVFYVAIISLMLSGFSVFFSLIAYAFKLPRRTLLWLIIGVTILYAGYARINGERIVVKEVSINAENISRPYHFVHLSDLHHGSTGPGHARRVVDRVAALDPEFVVITGDFIDEYHVTTDGIKVFDDLEVPIFLITGNHEYYLADGKVQEVIDDTSILLIDDTRIRFDELDIIGVNEIATIDGTIDTLGGIDPDRYSIVLDHQPKTDEVYRAEARGAQLMLSGHTHKGQIWPMNYLIQLGFKYVAGLYEIGDMYLYVNPGTGTLGPKMRVGSANEITLITLVPADR